MKINRQFDANEFLKALNESDGNGGRQLRMLVDLWVESGHSNGVEEPMRRILPEFARESIRNLAGTPLSIHIMRNGTVQCLFSFALGLRSPIVDSQALIDLEDRYGIYLFLLFLDSGDLRFRLAKCRHDGCIAPYFRRKRLRSIYKNGAVCPHHRPQAAGNRAREVERGELLELAVRFWPTWTPASHPNRALWIAGQVNALRIGTEMRITQKWVSRNRVAIQAKATKDGNRERRNHGTRKS
jgi:hypothetical protein